MYIVKNVPNYAYRHRYMVIIDCNVNNQIFDDTGYCYYASYNTKDECNRAINKDKLTGTVICDSMDVVPV